MKHRLKLWLREGWARLLFHTGLHALVDRAMPRRLTVLFGHCVDEPAINGMLPHEMKIRGERLQEVLGRLGRRYRLCTLGEGWNALGDGGGPSLVALTMDDGYRDNRTALVPLLESVGARATVFLETRPLDERGVNWTHKYHWVIGRVGEAELGRRYLAEASDAATRGAFEAILARGERLAYHLKRVLKYDAPPAERDAVIDRLFAAEGGDERALCDTLYLTWDEARELAAHGVELGGHTVSHAILSRVGEAGAREEVGGCRRSMERALGMAPRVFAYPFGRSWDYDRTSRDAVREAGFELAVNTHAGTNGPTSDPLQLRRVPIDDSTPIHLLVAEACGGFELLRRVGLDLSE